MGTSGTLKEKVDFLKGCAKNWDLNQIVSAYLSWLNTHNKINNMKNGSTGSTGSTVTPQ